jgi:calcium-dependent protein kinase
VAYQLLTGRLPFSGEDGAEVAELYMTKQVYTNKDVFRAVLYSDLDFHSPPWDRLSPEARDLVQALLRREPAERPTAERALAHPWLAEEEGGGGGGGSGGGAAAPLGDSIVQRLQRYGTYGRLKQAALRKVAHAAAAAGGADGGLPAALAAAFRRMDPGGTGRVPAAGLRQELEGGHFALTPAEAAQLLAQVDADEAGGVDYAQWVAAMADWKAVRQRLRLHGGGCALLSRIGSTPHLRLCL